MINFEYLTFSDAAKYADIARQIVVNGRYISTFNFNQGINSTVIQPVTPYSIATVFRIFGINDFSVLLTSIIYFLLLLVFSYLLTERIVKSKLVATLSVLAIGFNYNLLDYATSGASESPFIFEIVAGLYFITLRKKWSNLIGLIFLILLYFTRPQAIIYILGIIFYWLLINFNFKKAFVSMLVITFLSLIFYLIFSNQSLFAITQTVSSSAVSDALRGGESSFSLIQMAKKVFYNIYNFYKAVPDIFNPYMFILFVLGLFNWNENRLFNYFKLSSAFMVLLTVFVTALTIPFYRYIHPVIPLVYIISITSLVEIISKFEVLTTKIYINSKIEFLIKHRTLILAILLTLFFSVGQTLGVLLLDSRFEKGVKNTDMPPIYVEMSKMLEENTIDDGVVLTNLDTWGSWYGKRNTLWFPLKPQMIYDYQDKIKYIYLTSYKIDDANYYMGDEWREIFNNPTNQTVLPEFKFVKSFEFNSKNNYERENGKAVLLVRNDKNK